MNNQICPECGGAISNDFGNTLLFCTNCGAPIRNLTQEKTLSLSGEPTVVSPARVTNDNSSAANRKMTRYFLGCLGLLFGAVILGAVGIFGYWQWAKKNPVSSNSEYFGKIAPPKSQAVRFYLGDEPERLDPQSAGYSESVMTNALFDALVEYDARAENIKPSLVEAWERNADATVWTFRIRREAKWSDGKPFTAHDVVYSWRRALNSQTSVPNSSLLFVIKNAENFQNNKARAEEVGVRAVDDNTLEVVMEKPTPYFIKLVAANSVFRPVPEHGIGKSDKDWTVLQKEKMIVSGAFRLAEWTPEKQIVLERNPQFWDNANTKLDKITFPSPRRTSNYAPDLIQPYKLYEDGEIDATKAASPPKESYKDKKDYAVAKGIGTEFISLNTNVAPLNDERVRRALSLAIDREKMREKNISNFPTASFVPEIKGYENAKSAGFDPNQARKLLAEAGFPNGAGFPEIEYAYNTTEKNRDAAQFVQEQWQKELGVRVKLNNMEFKQFLQKRKALDFQGVARNGWIGDYADAHSFLGGMGEFMIGWSDNKFDDLVAKSNAEPDESKRIQFLKEAENYLLEQQFVIPLFTSANAMLVKPYVKNLAPNALDFINWREVYIDPNFKAE